MGEINIEPLTDEEIRDMEAWRDYDGRGGEERHRFLATLADRDAKLVAMTQRAEKAELERDESESTACDECPRVGYELATRHLCDRHAAAYAKGNVSRG